MRRIDMVLWGTFFFTWGVLDSTHDLWHSVKQGLWFGFWLVVSIVLTAWLGEEGCDRVWDWMLRTLSTLMTAVLVIAFLIDAVA